MKKTLVYHLYVLDNCRENFVYDIHRICLKRHLSCFDNVKITICVDDLKRQDLISFGYEWILSLGILCPLQINVEENDAAIGESRTFIREIVDCNSNGMVFFAHSKGVTLLKDDGLNESIIYWIATLYFYNFLNVEQIEKNFIGNIFSQKLFFGTLLCDSLNDFLIPKHYQGAFFWVNMDRYINLKNSGLIPKINIEERYLAEFYCGYIENISKINISDSFEAKRNYWDYNVYCGSKEEWVGLFEKYGNKNNMIEYVNTLFKEIGWVYND